MHPLVSIIIPYYNRPEKIKRCLNSVLNQTYQDFEILVVDDHSTIPLTLDADSRIKVFRNQKNLGPGLSRNVGLDNAKGVYIAFLDSDDYWDEKFLNTTLETIKKNKGVSFVYTKTIAFDDNKEYSKRDGSSYLETILPNILIEKRGWNSSSCLWEAFLIKNIRYHNTRNWEDYIFDVEVGLENNKIKFINEYLTYCDAGGEDKLSNINYFDRSLEKTYSLLKICMLLKDSEYMRNQQFRFEIIKELITSLEIIKHYNYTENNLDEKILEALGGLQNKIFFNLVNLSYKGLNKRMAPRVLNHIKNRFYK